MFYSWADGENEEVPEYDQENIEDDADLHFINEINDDDLDETAKDEEVFDSNKNLEKDNATENYFHADLHHNFDENDYAMGDDADSLVNSTGGQNGEDYEIDGPVGADFLNGLLNTECMDEDLNKFFAENIEHETLMEGSSEHVAEETFSENALMEDEENLNNVLRTRNWESVVLNNLEFLVESFAQENVEMIEENLENEGNFRALVVRQHLTKYFISKEGSLPHQWYKI